jgi:hypothetical protein
MFSIRYLRFLSMTSICFRYASGDIRRTDNGPSHKAHGRCR